MYSRTPGTTATRRPLTETEMEWWSGEAEEKAGHHRVFKMKGGKSDWAHVDDVNDGWHGSAPDKVVNMIQNTF